MLVTGAIGAAYFLSQDDKKLRANEAANTIREAINDPKHAKHEWAMNVLAQAQKNVAQDKEHSKQPELGR